MRFRVESAKEKDANWQFISGRRVFIPRAWSKKGLC
jgi:hypothetical protein